MNRLFDRLADQWYRADPATEEDIREVEDVFGVAFPRDYRAFLKWSNGGEGSIGPRYVSLWALEEFEVIHRDYRITKYLPAVVGIGTDGGDRCFALDYRHTPDAPPVIEVPFGDLGPDSVAVLAPGFAEWIESMLESS